MPQDPDGSRSICSIQTCKEFVEVEPHSQCPKQAGKLSAYIHLAHGRSGGRNPPAPFHGIAVHPRVHDLHRVSLTLVPPTPQPHSASKNHLRIPRFITNPPVTLKEPLNLNRANPADYVRSPHPIHRHLPPVGESPAMLISLFSSLPFHLPPFPSPALLTVARGAQDSPGAGSRRAPRVADHRTPAAFHAADARR